MSNVGYDPEKYYMDEYGNLIRKKTIDADNVYDRWIKKNKDKLDNSTNVKIPKGK